MFLKRGKIYLIITTLQLNDFYTKSSLISFKFIRKTSRSAFWSKKLSKYM